MCVCVCVLQTQQGQGRIKKTQTAPQLSEIWMGEKEAGQGPQQGRRERGEVDEKRKRYMRF